MSVLKKRRGGSWGYQFYLQGRRYKKFGYQTPQEAKAAEQETRIDLRKNPPLPPTALVNATSNHLIELAADGKSEHRTEALRLCFTKHVLPYFGEATLITDITFENVRQLVLKLKATRRYKPKSLWHVVSNLRSTLNWAVGARLLRENPINKATSPKLREIIGSTRSVKAPLDASEVERAAQSLTDPLDRGWFDTVRFTGMRKDEANRLRWDDVNFALAKIHIPGTKTELSDAWLPVAPIVIETLKPLYEARNPVCPWVFPSRQHQRRGQKAYDRRYLFAKIEKATGIKLKPKDLRDFFATEIASRVTDPAVVMNLLRHTNLRTTTVYLRTNEERMRNALKGLGATLGGYFGANTGYENAPNGIDPRILEFAKLLIEKGFGFDNWAAEKELHIAARHAREAHPRDQAKGHEQAADGSAEKE
jgi:integrase